MTTAKPRPPLAPGETRVYPVLPLRDIVVFPHMIAPLFVGRKKSILALEEAMRSDTFILLATQKNVSDEDPATEAIYDVGTLASVLQLLKLPDGTVKVLVEGAHRAKVVKYTDCSEYYEAEAVALGDTNDSGPNTMPWRSLYLIGMEACVGAHHLSRKLTSLGHDARLMPAKYVRPKRPSANRSPLVHATVGTWLMRKPDWHRPDGFVLISTRGATRSPQRSLPCVGYLVQHVLHARGLR
jgi:ATP-dependent protease La (LON) substrate-binding domain